MMDKILKSIIGGRNMDVKVGIDEDTRKFIDNERKELQEFVEMILVGVKTTINDMMRYEW